MYVAEDNSTGTASRHFALERKEADRWVVIWVGLTIAMILLVVSHVHGLDEPSPLAEARVLVDPDEAPWWELTVLPRIGPAIAGEIVSYRDAIRRDASLGADDRVFRQAQDLLPVHRIGPKTLQRIVPHLDLPDN